jgi:hypothetical protein
MLDMRYISQYRDVENYLWLICFLCAAASIVIIVQCNKIETQNEKSNRLLMNICLCHIVFAVVFFALGLFNIRHLLR